MPTLPDHETLLARLRPLREKWDGAAQPPTIEPAGPDEESVWDYPRPPAVRETREEVIVGRDGVEIARSRRALNVVETAGAPVHYVPPDDVQIELLAPTDHVTLCEWKGAAVHYDLTGLGRAVRHAAFSYPDPLTDLGRHFERIAGWFAFYPGRVECWLDGERVAPQPGGVYAGWVTSQIRGPVKGAPGTQGW